MKKLLLVYNPQAGHGSFRTQLHSVVNQFTSSGYLVTIYPTQSSGDAVSFVRDHVKDYDLLVASGGDGTLHECVNALMTLPKENRPPIGYIPAGSTNDFAVSHGLSINPLDAVQTIIDGTSTAYDIGQLGSNFFTYVAAFGIFTDVTYETPQDLKNAFGHLAYIFEGASRLTSYRPQHVKVIADGEEFEGDFVLGIVSNTTTVGGIKLARDYISLKDGLSELYLIRNSTSAIDFIELLNCIATRDYSSPLLIHRQVKDVIFESEVPIEWTVDGEYGGSFESIRAHTCEAAMNIIVPHSENDQETSSIYADLPNTKAAKD